MATSFTDGVTTVGASFLNAIFGSNGHVHDGQDQDGSAPKVNLKDHVDYDGDGDGTENGEMEVVTDTSSIHEIVYRHLTGGSFSRFVADRLKVAADIIEAASGELDVRDSASASTAGSGDIKCSHAFADNAPEAFGRIDVSGPTIADGYRLSSVSAGPGTGQWDVSLTTNEPDSSGVFCIADPATSTTGESGVVASAIWQPSSSEVRVETHDTSGTLVDHDFDLFVFFLR